MIGRPREGSGKRRVWLVFATLVFWMAMVLVPGVGAATLDVPGTYATIQAAINAANASDTINVAAGTYNENVDVNKQLNIIGAGASVTVVNAGIDDGFVVNANNVYISGFTVTGADSPFVLAAGVFLGNSNYSKVENVNASNNDYGIYLHASNYNTIANNIVSSNKNDGIVLGADSNYNTIANNTLSSDRYGIYLKSSSNNTIANNTANSNNKDGIYLESSNYNTIANNTANSNNNDGIDLSFSSNNNTLIDNTANSNSYGIFLWDSSGNTLINNIANSNNEYGIDLYSSSNYNTLINNNASNNDQGIRLYSSSNYNTLINNNASNNSVGIYLESSNYNTIANNTANSNSYGIDLSFSSNNNTLIDNTANSNSYGIFLWDSSNYNTIANNIANSNNNDGIVLYSSNNTIYNNYFDNTNNAYDDGDNYWNTTKTLGTNIIGGPYIGGNYWSDYTGSDIDGDGLGDILLPYNSGGNITTGGDWLPLTTASGSATNEVCASQCHIYKKKLDITTDFYPNVQTSFDGYEAFQGLLNEMEGTPMNVTDPTIELRYDTGELYGGEFDYFKKAQPTIWTPGYAFFEFSDMHVTNSDGTHGIDKGERNDTLGFSVLRVVEDNGLLTEDGNVTVTVSAVLSESVNGHIALNARLRNQTEFKAWVVDWSTTVPPKGNDTDSEHVNVHFDTKDETLPKEYNLTVTFYVDKIIPANITVKPQVQVYTRKKLQEIEGIHAPTAIINGTMFNMNTTFNSSNSNLTWKLVEAYVKRIIMKGGAESLESYARFRIRKHFVVGSDDDSISSGDYTRNIWYGLHLTNLDDTSNDVLGNINFSAIAPNITGAIELHPLLGTQDYATWNSTHINWSLPSKFDIAEGNKMRVLFETNYSEAKYMNVGLERWMNQTVFTSDGYQLVKFNVTFEDKDFDFAKAVIEGYDHDEVNASILPETFTTDAPLKSIDYRKHGIHAQFDEGNIKTGVAYKFSVVVEIKLNGNYTVLYKPWVSVGEGHGDNSTYGGVGYKAEIPSSMLPDYVSYASVSTNTSNLWLLIRQNRTQLTLWEIMDATPPTITSLTVTPSAPAVGGLVNISAEVVDALSSVDTVLVDITYPNSTVITKVSDAIVGSLYYFYDFKASIYGTYNAKVRANDSAGNTNTLNTSFWAVNIYVAPPVNTSKNTTTTINESLDSTDTEITFTTIEDVNGGVIYITMAQSASALKAVDLTQANASDLGTDEEAVGKYIEINVSSNLASNISWIVVKMYYTTADLDRNEDGSIGPGDINENSLKLWWYCPGCPAASKWRALETGNNYTDKDGPYVYGSGVSATSTGSYLGYVWANISHLSVYGIAGELIATPSYTPPGGGGGGGAPTTDQTADATEVTPTDADVAAQVEATFTSIAAGKKGTIAIPDTENMPLTEIAINVKNKVSNVKVVVKSLTSKPANITKNVSGEVLRYLNVEHTNIEDADIDNVTIKFKVEKTWTTEKNIDPAAVALNRYSEDTWNALPTTKTGEDTTYVYYSAESPGLSVFGISGSVTVPPPTPAPTTLPPTTVAPATTAPPPTTRPPVVTTVPPTTTLPPTTPAPTPVPTPTPTPAPKPVYMSVWFVVSVLIVLLAGIVYVLDRQGRISVREELDRLREKYGREGKEEKEEKI